MQAASPDSYRAQEENYLLCRALKTQAQVLRMNLESGEYRQLKKQAVQLELQAAQLLARLEQVAIPF